MNTPLNTTSTNTSIAAHKPLAGKVAFIHGGSRGIGAATARRLARDGASVAIGYASSAIAAQALVEDIQAAGGHAIALKADATDAAAQQLCRLDILVKGLARDLGPRGITVNNVAPGPVDTDMNPSSGDFAATMHGLMAIPRHGKAEEIAGMVAYLASPEAAFVTGADLLIDGGFAA
jgi:3-oxoacyl-[acyl-carrier protein] reductase